MSCNGCRVLRKGCSDDCMLRDCLVGIESPQAQAHATVFVAKFFGRAALMSFLSAVPSHQRSALFRSLLYEAVGRSINPVNGAVGLLWAGNWHLCQSGVHRVLCGGALTPLPDVSSGGGASLPTVDDGFGRVLDFSRQPCHHHMVGSESKDYLKRKVSSFDELVLGNNNNNNINVKAHDVHHHHHHHEYCLGRSSVSLERVVVVDGRGETTASEGSETSSLGSSAEECGTPDDRKLLRLFF